MDKRSERDCAFSGNVRIRYERERRNSMCAIAGVLGLPTDKKTLDQMNADLKARKGEKVSE